jgi:hypothetical protein
VRDLALLETAAQKSPVLDAWVGAASAAMRLTDKEPIWLFDEDLHSFFAAEAKLPDAEHCQRRSAKGLW